MSAHNQTLLRKLVIAVALKLLVLLGLWWGLVREQHVAVDDQVAAEHLLGPQRNDHKE